MAPLRLGLPCLALSHLMSPRVIQSLSPRLNPQPQTHRYDTGMPKVVFVERKTHEDSWTGELSVKERFALPADKVVPFMDGAYTVEEVRRGLCLCISASLHLCISVSLPFVPKRSPNTPGRRQLPSRGRAEGRCQDRVRGSLLPQAICGVPAGDPLQATTAVHAHAV